MPARSASSRPDTLASLAENIVSNNDKLRADMEALLAQMMAEAKYTMKWGTREERAQLMKLYVPHMFRGLDHAAARNSNADREAEWEALRKTMGGGVTGET